MINLPQLQARVDDSLPQLWALDESSALGLKVQALII